MDCAIFAANVRLLFDFESVRTGVRDAEAIVLAGGASVKAFFPLQKEKSVSGGR